MTDIGRRVAEEAEKLVGTPFLLQGRNPETGIDCIGLVALALQRARGGEPVAAPSAYRLRNKATDQHLVFAVHAGLQVVSSNIKTGDVLHTRPGPAQDHLLVALNAKRFVHAHAGLRRVVQCQQEPEWLILHHWRPC